MADLLKETLALRYPRLLASGVDYNDIQLVLGRLTRFEDWCAEWARMAEAHEALGEAALREGRTLTAVRAFARAAIYYHTGQSVSFDDPAEKRRVQERQRDAYRKAAPHLRPPARQVEVPVDGITFTGNLRLPEGARPAPCVLLNPGADSTKEEFYTLEHEFLARGVATFAYDGPGQGLTWRAMKLRPDFEKPVGAVIDALAGIPQIDGARLGIWGRSFGGYAAPRAACFEGRLRACISIGGFYALQTIWDRLPVTVKDTLAFAMGAAGHAEARERAAEFTLAGALKRLACPFLIVHSGRDAVVPVEESERIRSEAGGPTDLVVFPEGNHVCDNIPYQARPLMADWMAARLGAS